LYFKTKIYSKKNLMTLNLYESWRYIKLCEEFEIFHFEKKNKGKAQQICDKLKFDKQSNSHGRWQT